MKTNTAANRKEPKYTGTEQMMRVLWAGVSPLFRLSPRVFWAWRVFLLRLFGARIGRKVHVYPSARIYFPWNLEIGDWSAVGEGACIYNLGPIRIGRHVTISQYAHLCAGTHDYRDPSFPLLKTPITIEDQAWICADAFIGPGLTVRQGAVVGARAVVVGNVDAWKIVAGNPARVIRERVPGTENAP